MADPPRKIIPPGIVPLKKTAEFISADDVWVVVQFHSNTWERRRPRLREPGCEDAAEGGCAPLSSEKDVD